MLSQEHMDKCFGNDYVPADIRRVAERICSAYNINGLCDPMYIANVIAKETGRGDGRGKFTEQSKFYIDTSSYNARMIDGQPWFPHPTIQSRLISFQHMEQTPEGWFYTVEDWEKA